MFYIASLRRKFGSQTQKMSLTHTRNKRVKAIIFEDVAIVRQLRHFVHRMHVRTFLMCLKILKKKRNSHHLSQAERQRLDSMGMHG